MIPRLSLERDIDGIRCSTMMAIEAHREKDELPHRHSFYTIIWVQKAKGKHMVDFHSNPIRDQQLFLLHPDRVHQFKIEGKPQGWVLTFQPEFLQLYSQGIDLLQQLSLFDPCQAFLAIDVKELFRDELDFLFESIRDEILLQEPQWQRMAAAKLKQLLIVCHRLCLSQGNLTVQKDDRPSEIVREFKDLLEKFYREEHSVSFYAAQLAITPAHLNDTLKHQTGKHSKEHIQERILLEAQRASTQAELSMKAIAMDLGFSDSAHFSRFFKKQAGESFSEFRERIREKYI